MDSVQAFNAPEEVEIGDETFLLSQLKLKEWAGLQAWLKKQNPSPLVRVAQAIQEAQAAGSPIPPTIQDVMLTHAHEADLRWPPKPGSWHWIQLLDSTEGGTAKFLQTVISRHRPGFKESEATELVGKLKDGQMAEVWRVSTMGDPLPVPKSTGTVNGTVPSESPNMSPTTGLISATS